MDASAAWPECSLYDLQSDGPFRALRPVLKEYAQKQPQANQAGSSPQTAWQESCPIQAGRWSRYGFFTPARAGVSVDVQPPQVGIYPCGMDYLCSAEEQLRKLTGMLQKSPDQLTPETQAYLTTLNAQATQSIAKSLHNAVTKLEKAQNALTEAQGARLQLHSKWRNFVTEAVTR